MRVREKALRRHGLQILDGRVQSGPKPREHPGELRLMLVHYPFGCQSVELIRAEALGPRVSQEPVEAPGKVDQVKSDRRSAGARS